MLLATSLATPAAKRVQKWILVDRDETHKAEIRKEAFCKEYNVSGFVYINGGDQVDDTDKGYKIGRAKNEKCVTTRKNVMKQMSSKNGYSSPPQSLLSERGSWRINRAPIAEISTTVSF